jgi:hypothetical protein
MRLRLAFALTIAALSGTPALAGQATAQFGIRLVIAPACPVTDQGSQTDGVAGTRAQALDIAATELGLPASQLLVTHDQADTGWWIVSLSGRGGSKSGPQPVLRVEKCSGIIEHI